MDGRVGIGCADPWARHQMFRVPVARVRHFYFNSCAALCPAPASNHIDKHTRSDAELRLWSLLALVRLPVAINLHYRLEVSFAIAKKWSSRRSGLCAGRAEQVPIGRRRSALSADTDSDRMNNCVYSAPAIRSLDTIVQQHFFTANTVKYEHHLTIDRVPSFRVCASSRAFVCVRAARSRECMAIIIIAEQRPNATNSSDGRYARTSTATKILQALCMTHKYGRAYY